MYMQGKRLETRKPREVRLREEFGLNLEEIDLEESGEEEIYAAAPFDQYKKSKSNKAKQIEEPIMIE